MFHANLEENENITRQRIITKIWGAAIAQWNCLRIPSCRPGFESQAAIFAFSFIVFVLYLSCEKSQNKQKEAGFGPF